MPATMEPPASAAAGAPPPARHPVPKQPPDTSSDAGAASDGQLTAQPSFDRDEPHRAVHSIRLSALRHNYGVVEGAAARQRCSVIVVAKADGYGHGAAETAVHLADACGADAFAVATLEEAIALRRAFRTTPPGGLGPDGLRTTGGGGAGGAIQPSPATSRPPSKPPSRRSSAVSELFEKPPPPPPQQRQSLMSSPAPPALVKGGTPPNGVAGTKRPASPPTPGVGPSAVAAAAAAVAGALHQPPPAVPGAGPRPGPIPSLRPPRIRILVLGPPVGYPRCFDLYHHHEVELMVSGPEVAEALIEWVADAESRRRTEVERAAMDSMERALAAPQTKLSVARPKPPSTNPLEDDDDDEDGEDEDGGDNEDEGEHDADTGAGISPDWQWSEDGIVAELPEIAPKKAKVRGEKPKAGGKAPSGVGGVQLPHASATLSNVTGDDLAREVRSILLHQRAALDHSEQQAAAAEAAPSPAKAEAKKPLPPRPSTVKPAAGAAQPAVPATAPAGGAAGTPFRGIEDAARQSRQREMKEARRAVEETGEVFVEGDSAPVDDAKPARVAAAPARKRLRWHVLVDSGMGRLGFKSDHRGEDGVKEKREGRVVANGDGFVCNGAAAGQGRDTVAIIKALHDVEVHDEAPIEFYGMCTHMADANSKSGYTNEQMDRFLALLGRVRAAGISVPTVSTDNSSALLTSNLTHFDPAKILSQPLADTRGYVRTGGGIFGQRPSFRQLRAVSTLTASVRHVATLKQGESVGYDRAYIAPTDVRIATLTIGFADGYPRELGNSVGRVCIRGAVFPVAGNVCMDMLMVELGAADDVEGVGSKVTVGDVAVLWGPEGGDEDSDGRVRLQDLAANLKTTLSALTCGLDKVRVTRRYV